VDPRSERVAKNEALFREVNERIKNVTGHESAEYLCECGDATCTETIPMTMSDYEIVRSDARQFVVLPGHEVPDLENVVARNDTFLVVQKKPGEPTALAVERDPRT
jgi:hypothetical protein